MEDIETKSNVQDNNDNNKIKRTRNRLTKKQQFAKEREELINQFNNLLGINETKNYVYLYDLENDLELKQHIKNLEKDIARYHKCGMWGYYSTDPKKGKGNEIALLRAVYKDNDIMITTKNKIIERNSKKINSTVYYFNKIISK